MEKTIKEFCINNYLLPMLGREFMYGLRYYHQRHHWPNFYHPSDLSEILISRILSGYFDKYANYADKVKVRDYVKSKGLGDTLLKHYFYWKSPSEIRQEELPEKFVLKTSNGSGGKEIIMCRDKKIFNLDASKKKLSKDLNKKHYYELHYNLINPCIICEELMDTGSDAWPTDYKFTCIHGKPVDIFIATEREKGTKFCTLNLNWSILDNTKPEYLPTKTPEKPKHLDLMIEIAKALSADFDFVRVDLYEYNNKVYFGELTFTPWGGIMYSYTDTAIKKYGELLQGNKLLK